MYSYFWLSLTCLSVCVWCAGPRSVFELLDIKDRERLSEIRKAAEEKRAALQDRFQSGVAPSDFRTQLQVSKAQADMQLRPPASDTAQQALSIWSSPTAQTSQTFRPFNKDPSKQARYDHYISHLKQGNKGETRSVLQQSWYQSDLSFLNTKRRGFCDKFSVAFYNVHLRKLFTWSHPTSCPKSDGTESRFPFDPEGQAYRWWMDLPEINSSNQIQAQKQKSFHKPL